MNYLEIIKKYESLGLETEEGSVEAGFVYPRHCHGTTYLFITKGCVRLKRERDDKLIKYCAGDEFIVADGEYHEGLVGVDGYSYVAGWNQKEYDKYPEDQWY